MHSPGKKIPMTISEEWKKLRLIPPIVIICILTIIFGIFLYYFLVNTFEGRKERRAIQMRRRRRELALAEFEALAAESNTRNNTVVYRIEPLNDPFLDQRARVDNLRRRSDELLERERKNKSEKVRQKRSRSSHTVSFIPLGESANPNPVMCQQ